MPRRKQTFPNSEQNGTTQSARDLTINEARELVRQTVQSGRLAELLGYVSNKHQQIVINGWAADLPRRTIAKQVAESGGCYQSAEMWAKRHLKRWSQGIKPPRKGICRKNRFLKLLHGKAEREGKTPKEVISEFPKFLQPLAERIMEHPQESGKQRAEALDMTIRSVVGLEHTKLCWLAGAKRPITEYTKLSFWEMVDLLGQRLREDPARKTFPASLRKELWWRKFCAPKPVDLLGVAICNRDWGKLTPFQQEIHDLLRIQMRSGRSLKDIVGHVRTQLGPQIVLYVLNTLSISPWPPGEFGLTVDKSTKERIISVIRGASVPEFGLVKVAEGFREATAELFGMADKEKGGIMSRLSPFERHLLANRGLKRPPSSLKEIIDDIARLGFSINQHRQTVSREEKKLVRKLRKLIDRARSGLPLDDIPEVKAPKVKPSGPKPTSSKSFILLKNLATAAAKKAGFSEFLNSLEPRERFLLSEWLLANELLSFKKFLESRHLVIDGGKSKTYSDYYSARRSLEKKLNNFLID